MKKKLGYVIIFEASKLVEDPGPVEPSVERLGRTGHEKERLKAIEGQIALRAETYGPERRRGDPIISWSKEGAGPHRIQVKVLVQVEFPPLKA